MLKLFFFMVGVLFSCSSAEGIHEQRIINQHRSMIKYDKESRINMLKLRDRYHPRLSRIKKFKLNKKIIK